MFVLFLIDWLSIAEGLVPMSLEGVSDPSFPLPPRPWMRASCADFSDDENPFLPDAAVEPTDGRGEAFAVESSGRSLRKEPVGKRAFYIGCCYRIFSRMA